MKILITGGAGYIGSHTCKELANNGHTPIVYDNLSTGHREFVRYGDFVHGDILDTQRLRETLRRFKPDGIIHFAAFAYVEESVLNPGKYFRNNVVGTLSILEAMRDENVQFIVVSSSCAVYGQPEQIPIKTNCPTAPINPYGASKLFMERMLFDFQKSYDIRWAALRYFNAAGCDKDGEIGEWHEPETHIIPRVIAAAQGKISQVQVFGDDYPTPDGTCIRDYVHVKDLAQAHILAMQYIKNGNQPQVFNLGSGNGFSVKEIINSVGKISGEKVPHAICKRRDGDPACLIADISESISVLQWNIKYSTLENIIETAWIWSKNSGH